MEATRGDAAAATWRFHESRRTRRRYSVETTRGDAADATWIFYGDSSRRRRGYDVESPVCGDAAVFDRRARRLAGELRGAVIVDDSFWSLDEQDETLCLVLDVQKSSGSRELWPGFLTREGDSDYATITDTVFFDVALDGGDPQRVEIGLFGDDAPKTAANFKGLCEGFDDEDGEFRSYAGSPFHRVIPGFMCQGGDVTNGDGTGGASIYGGTFDDEAFPFAHAYSGLVAMANSGPNTNKSQFYITLADCTWLDGKHVVFGRVTKGMTETVRSIEKLGSNSGDLSGECTIVRCGVVGAE